MKIIDLLNKIANGEGVPKQIKYKGKIFDYNKENQNYAIWENCYLDFLIGEDITAMLNDEVEVIEEDKKIEPIPNRYDKQAIINYKQANFNSNDMKEICKSIGFLMENLNIVRDKLNEIIDKINESEE